MLRRPAGHLRILSVAYPLFPVHSGSAGGAEQILFLLERSLVRLGCQSVVVAAKGSQVSGRIIETPTYCEEISEEAREAAEQAHLESIEGALKSESFDLIHFHGLNFHRYLPHSYVPKLATLHLPPSWYPDEIFRMPALHLNCVSASQASCVAENGQIPVVPNGVEVERYRATAQAKTHLLWLGRICPEKGVHLALQVAHRLDMPLILAGPVHPFSYHEAYFREQVAPLLDGRRRHIGPVGIDEKIALLRNAYAVLIPSLVAETSSLVAMEAISSGTPAIVFRAGALPEIVDHGITGFVVDDIEQMVAAVKQCSQISPAACRARAEQSFSVERMAQNYLGFYRRIIDAR